MTELKQQVVKATKWSTITELAVKLIAPISTMVLARLLTPEAFGVLVTATMVINFAEIFTDAGFQKYLIQHDFKSKNDLYQSTNVAFWSNLIMSLILWILIIIFSEQIAELVGNKGQGLVIIVSGLCIPLAAFSSIQMAIYKRNLDFKTLFIVRMVGVLIPLVVTIPLALIFRSYWALILGMILLNISNAILLTWKSDWKPTFCYSWIRLKIMISFTFWSMIEAITIWMTTYIDFFFVGKMLNDYYLGIYQTSMSTVAQFMGIITAATTPILFSSLSRLQNDNDQFKILFFKFQKLVALLIIPLGVGLYIYRDLITEILLGSQWMEASFFIGVWALSSTMTIVLAHYSSECYRAKGRPKLSVAIQLSHIIFLVPFVIWAIPYGFNFLCEVRALVRLELIIANMIMMAIFIKITPLAMMKNITPSLLGGFAMFFVGFLLPSNNVCMTSLSIIISCLIYVGIVMLFPIERHLVLNLKSIIKNK